jgi:hypothetical protein
MLKKVIALFKRPYPVDFTAASNFKYGITIGAFVYIFMTIFQPFGLNSLPDSPRNTLFIGYGLVTFLSITLSSFLFPSLLPGLFREEKWNTGKSVIYMSWVALIIGIGSYFATLGVCKLYSLPSGWVKLKIILPSTFFIGIIPITIVIILESSRLQHRSERIVNETNRRLDEHAGRTANAVTEEKVMIVAENNRDKFNSTLAELLHIDAEENYIQIHYKKEKADHVMMRSSLTRIDRQLRPFYPRLFRCHRAHIVNIGKIRKVAGNAQGLRLTLEDVAEQIPVSRRYVEEFRRVVVNRL